MIDNQNTHRRFKPPNKLLLVCVGINLIFHLSTKPESLNTFIDRKSTRLNSSHLGISYAVFCLKKKKRKKKKKKKRKEKKKEKKKKKKVTEKKKKGKVKRGGETRGRSRRQG